MRRLLCLAVSLILVTGILVGIEDHPSQTTIAEHVIRNGVEIHAVQDGSITVGSGVLYRVNGELMVLTAAHVVPQDGGMCLITQNSMDDSSVCLVWSGEVVAKDVDSDWAIVRPVGETQSILGGTAFMLASPRVGHGVYASGSPLGEENTLSEGIVANHNRTVEWNKDKHIVVTCNGAAGSSGGGVYDIHTGKCFGIVVRRNPVSNMLYIVPIETIRKDLAEMGKSNLLPS